MDELYDRLLRQQGPQGERVLTMQVKYSNMAQDALARADDSMGASQEARQRGDHDRAILLALESVGWALRGLDDEHPYIADLYVSTSITYRTAGLYEQAIACASQARDIAAACDEADLRAKALNALGVACLESGAREDAIAAYSEGLNCVRDPQIRAVLAQNRENAKAGEPRRRGWFGR